MGGIETTYRIRTQMSVTSDANGIKLVNDQLAPSGQYYYGTDINGTKGYVQNFVIWDGGNVWSPYLSAQNDKTTAGENIFLGIGAGQSITSALRNTIYGHGSQLYFMTTGQYNAFVGYGNGLQPGCNPFGSVSIGAFNDATTISSSYNVTIGYGNLAGSPNGASNNVAIGVAQMSSKTGNFNICIGYSNLQNEGGATPAGAASNNYIIGVQNARLITSGSNNWIIGKLNLNAATTAGTNLVMGFNNANDIVTGFNNTFIGQNITAGNSNRQGAIYLGYEAYGTQNYQFIVGGSGATQITDLNFGGSPTNPGTDDDGFKTFTWRIPQRYKNAGGGSDQNAHDLIIAGSQGIGLSTGEATGGNIYFQTQESAGSGTQVNNLMTRFTIYGSTGDVNFSSYPNTRNDGDPAALVQKVLTNMLGTDANGDLLSFAAASDVYAPGISGAGGFYVLLNANYLRIGEMVYGTVRFVADLSTGVGGNVSVTVDVPVASNFAADDDIIGTYSFLNNAATTYCDSVYVYYAGGAQRVTVKFANVNAGWTGGETITINFSYKILP